MNHYPVADEAVASQLARAVKAAVLGQRVSFEFDGGMTRTREGDKVVEVPNGTLTIRVYVNGGAVNQDGAPAVAQP